MGFGVKLAKEQAMCQSQFQRARISGLLPGMILLVVWVVAGCQTPTARPAVTPSAAQATRNNCYSLLHQLFEEQKDVSLLRFIKREDSEVKVVTKKIAEASRIGGKELEEFARQDPSLRLDDLWLPPGEVATRASIAAAKKKAILGQKDGSFELSLLLSQTEALSYAWNLAKVAGENETNPERAGALARMSEEMQNLYQHVFMLLLLETKSIATDPIQKP
jgi:hypothetical protein